MMAGMKGCRNAVLVRHRGAILIVSGVAALAAGVSVYALDRPPGSVGFLPRGLVADSGSFGLLAGSLPTFLHTMAFALITAALLRQTRQARLAACAIWAAVNLAFEASQHAAFREFTGFGMHGAFDPLDLLAALLGAVAAYIFMEISVSERRVRT